MTVTIYHNPDCGTSRNTLEMIRNAGIQLTVIEYVKTPPSRDQLVRMIAEAGLTVREAIREKGTPYAELGLDDPKLTDDQLLDAMLENPILINRPFVITPIGTRLTRPSELVLDILPATHKGAFTKEDGEAVVSDAIGGFSVPVTDSWARVGAGRVQLIKGVTVPKSG
uniref:Arsenate reductase n=1 Tax=Rhizobium leguminosarum TaxID=384 RepID=Q2EEV1_RHILE|nr:arsenate reductase [Rhizobium leguminosarum]